MFDNTYELNTYEIPKHFNKINIRTPFKYLLSLEVSFYFMHSENRSMSNSIIRAYPIEKKKK